MFIKYIFHKIQKWARQMGFKYKKSLVLAKMKNLTILIIWVSIEPGKPEFKQFTELKNIENWASYSKKIFSLNKFHYSTKKCLF